MKVLDLGCGLGNNTYNIYVDENNVVGVDIDENNVLHCQKKFPNHKFLKVYGEKLPFKDDEFDLIHSIDVLEHVDSLSEVLGEATRVLKKGGKFIIEVPYWRSELLLLKINSKYRDQIHHVRMFKTNEMEEILASYGFSLSSRKRIKFVDNIILIVLFLSGRTITGQVGSFNGNKSGLKNMVRLKIRSIISFLRPIFRPFDQLFPKSISFIFTKE